MLEPLYTAAEMRAAEERYPGSTEELMERAGSAAARHALDYFAAARSFTVVCGAGNNGGDGRIAAMVLEEAGREVRVVDAKAEPEADLGDPEVLVDALFGTGFSGEPREDAAALIARMNELGAPIIAIDVPSGVDASTGEVAGVAVDADLTVTFHGEKVGLEVAPGRFRAGHVEVVDIGLEPSETTHRRVTPAVLGRVPLRASGDNKYSAGSVLVVGGAPGTTGAVCLTAEAAFRADAGYVTVCAPKESLPVVETRLLEAVKRELGEVFDAVEKAGSLALGPGLGRDEERRKVVRRLLEETDLPAVVDADALFELEPFERDAPTVLTPHSGELARLLGETSDWVDAHRLEALARAVERFGCVVLLKGAEMLIGAPGEGALVCSIGRPSLATAGTGDVLTGIVGAFLAKGLEPRLAAAAGAAALGRASIEAPHEAGLVASDLLAVLPRVLDG
jgi:NAD(P)H-hydrate epimerase